jgi:thiol-disulfide isomerase/thioredoxin
MSLTRGSSGANAHRPQSRMAMFVTAAALGVIAWRLHGPSRGVIRHVALVLPKWGSQVVRDEVVDRTLFDSMALSGHRIGPRSARVTVVVFGTYGCGYCNTFSHTLDSLRAAFPRDVAVVSYTYAPTLSRESLIWHLSAECAADQGRFGVYDSLLYGHLEFAANHNGWLALADTAGINDLAAFYGCVRTEADRARLLASTRLGERLGVRGTPTFVINGILGEGTRSFADLARFTAEVIQSSGPTDPRLLAGFGPASLPPPGVR